MRRREGIEARREGSIESKPAIARDCKPQKPHSKHRSRGGGRSSLLASRRSRK